MIKPIIKKFIIFVIVLFPITFSTGVVPQSVLDENVRLQQVSLLLQKNVAEVKCLAEAVYHEARGESKTGRLAVAHVIVNRKNSNKFPHSICGVIRQPGQFSYDAKKKIMERAKYVEAVRLAKLVISGKTNDPSSGSLFFGTMEQQIVCTARQKVTIGSHRFC